MTATADPTAAAPTESPFAEAPGVDPATLRLLETVFGDSADGVLAVQANGCRVYSNAALDAMLACDARVPTGTAAPPPYIARDQLREYWRILGETCDMLDGGEPSSTAIELVSRDRRRIPTRVTITLVSAQHGPRIGVWLVRPIVRERAHASFASRPATSIECRFNELTARENEVLQLLLNGLRVSLIARELFVSEHTVRNHLKSIFRKLDVHSQVELIERCMH